MPRSLLLGLAFLTLLSLALGLAGCNTVEGVGRDLEAAGQAVSGTAP